MSGLLHSAFNNVLVNSMEEREGMGDAPEVLSLNTKDVCKLKTSY